MVGFNRAANCTGCGHRITQRPEEGSDGAHLLTRCAHHVHSACLERACATFPENRVREVKCLADGCQEVILVKKTPGGMVLTNQAAEDNENLATHFFSFDVDRNPSFNGIIPVDHAKEANKTLKEVKRNLLGLTFVVVAIATVFFATSFVGYAIGAASFLAIAGAQQLVAGIVQTLNETDGFAYQIEETERINSEIYG